MKACRCTRGELGFGDDSFRFRVGNALLKYVPYEEGGVLGKRPAAGARGATHRVAFFLVKNPLSVKNHNTAY